MDQEHLSLYLKLQNFYVDTHQLLTVKKYFKSLEQFSIINHAIDDYLKSNKVNDITQQMFLYLKENCQKNMSELNNYLYNDNNIVIIEDDNKEEVDVEESIEDINDVVSIEPPSFFSNLFYQLFPCIQPDQLQYYLFKKLFEKEKVD
jgi:hypothetical protein